MFLKTRVMGVKGRLLVTSMVTNALASSRNPVAGLTACGMQHIDEQSVGWLRTRLCSRDDRSHTYDSLGASHTDSLCSVSMRQGMLAYPDTTRMQMHRCARLQSHRQTCVGVQTPRTN